MTILRDRIIQRRGIIIHKIYLSDVKVSRLTNKQLKFYEYHNQFEVNKTSFNTFSMTHNLFYTDC